MDEFRPEGTPVEGDSIAQNQILAAPVVTEEPVQAPESAQPEPQETVSEKDRNFRIMREDRERIARERDEALRRLQEYEMRSAKPQHQEEPEADDDIDLDIKDDDLVEGKHLQKMKTYIKKLQAQQKTFQKRATEATAETRLKSQYPDFDTVMTMENMQALSRAYPELAASVNATGDLYNKAVSVYTLIKKFGIHDDKPYEAEKERIVANQAKPKPLTSISPQQGDTPLSRANVFANGLTDELKKKLREEMAAASKRY